MTLEFIDSFDHYDTGHVDDKYTSVAGAVVIDAAGRFGSALRIGTSGSINKTLSAKGLRHFGFGFKITGTRSATTPIMYNYDSGTSQCGLAIHNDGTLQGFRTSTGILLGSPSTYAVPLDTWIYLEIKFLISDTVGEIVVNVNGAQVLNTINVDTKATANATINSFNFQQCMTGTSYTYFDDLYVLNSDGAVNNTFLGDCRVEAILPDAAGASTQWTPSAGVNYQCVDETVPNDDTDYVSSATVTQLDLYSLANLVTASGTVKGVQAIPHARKDDAGVRVIRSVIRTGATNYNGADKTLGLTWLYYPEIWELNPNTAAAWTIADVNGLEAGAEVVS